MVALQTVEIPGYREAIRKERKVRDAAFLDGNEIVCGVEVRPLCLRRAIWLEHAMNGFVVPCRFDNEAEMLAHGLQVLFFCSPQFEVPASPRLSFWRSFRDGWREQMFLRQVLRGKKSAALLDEIEAWMTDSFMDSPAGGGNNEIAPPSYASYPALIVDKFAEAGLPFTYDQILDMPLRRLWQHWRIASARIDGASLNNPSDEIAVKHLAGVRP